MKTGLSSGEIVMQCNCPVLIRHYACVLFVAYGQVHLSPIWEEFSGFGGLVLKPTSYRGAEQVRLSYLAK